MSESNEVRLRIKEAHIGISILENGEKVITPFGRWGRAYAFSDVLNKRFEHAMKTSFWLSALWLVCSYVLFFLGELNKQIQLEVLVVGVVFLDFCRLIAFRIIFGSAQVLKLWSRLSDFEKSFALISRSPISLVVAATSFFFEMIFFVNLIFDIAHRSGKETQAVIAVIVLHLTLYLTFGLRSYMRN